MNIGSQDFVYGPKVLVSKIGDDSWTVEFIGSAQCVMVRETKLSGREAQRGLYDPQTAWIAVAAVNECDPK